MRHLFRALRLDPVIYMPAPVTIRPAIEPAIRQGHQVVRRNVRPELVPLIEGSPQAPAGRLKSEADRVPQSTRIKALRTGFEVDFPDGRARLLLVQPIFGDVARRADADIKLRFVRARYQAAGPVLVVKSGREIGDLLAGCRNRCLAGRVRKPEDRIGIGDVKVGTDERHIPKGELSPVVKAVRISATPSLSASRSRVMRFALGTAAPAFPINSFMIAPLMPLSGSG